MVEWSGELLHNCFLFFPIDISLLSGLKSKVTTITKQHTMPLLFMCLYQGQSVQSSGDSPSGQAPSLGVVASSTGQNSEPSTFTAAIPPRPPNGHLATLQHQNTNSDTLKNPVAPIATAVTMDPKVTAELMHLRSVIKEKDRRLDELHSEVDKLSSVLQQHISECDTWKKVSWVVIRRIFRIQFH